MHHRLTRIATRTGDRGVTGLGDGSRLPKDHPRIRALGTLDELSCQLGVVRAQGPGAATDALLLEIQQRLFDLGGELAIPGREVLGRGQVEALETALEGINADLPPLEEFVLPGGHPAAAHCHLARAVCRRAERALVTLSHREPVNSASLIYLNRLSDLLFVCARRLNREAGEAEPTWQHGPES